VRPLHRSTSFSHFSAQETCLACRKAGRGCPPQHGHWDLIYSLIHQRSAASGARYPTAVSLLGLPNHSPAIALSIPPIPGPQLTKLVCIKYYLFCELVLIWRQVVQTQVAECLFRLFFVLVSTISSESAIPETRATEELKLLNHQGWAFPVRSSFEPHEWLARKYI
jgi:hypothetical protein